MRVTPVAVRREHAAERTARLMFTGYTFRECLAMALQAVATVGFVGGAVWYVIVVAS